MAKYLVLIYEAEPEADTEPDPAVQAEYAKNWTFIDKNRDAIVAGEALMPTATATSLRRDGAGGYTVTDGPFLETKEAVAGFYLLEAPDLDVAIDLARQVPAPLGGLEIRPVRVFD